MNIKCPYDCKCTRKIKGYCCADRGFVCTAKEKEKRGNENESNGYCKKN